MTTKHKHTVLSIEDKITICECLDKESSKIEIAYEYNISKLTFSELFLFHVYWYDCPNFLII